MPLRSLDIKFLTYGSYIWLPVLATLFWFATLISLLLLWTLRDDHRRYQVDEGTVVFISDVGAAHKALFVPGCACVLAFYTLSMFAERWLRHVDRIPGTVRSRERNLDIAAVTFAVLGGVALVVLSVFDTFNHSRIHWSFTVVFVFCVAISTVCQTFEIMYLKTDHPDRAHLRRIAVWKLVVVGLALVLAVAFAICYGVCRGNNSSPRCNVVTSAAGVLEWAVAFVLDVYFLTLVADLWPAAKSSPRHLRRVKNRESGQRVYGGSSGDLRGTIDTSGAPSHMTQGEQGLQPMAEHRV